MKKIKIYSKNWNRIVLPAFAILTLILLVLGIKMAHNSGSEFNPLFLELYFAFIIANYIIASVISDLEIENGRIFRIRYPENLHPGQPYDIYVTGLAKKPQEILEILNHSVAHAG